MKGNNWIQNGTRTNLFRIRNIKSEDDIDDKTFKVWKSELQKELTSFWESIIS